MNDYLNTELIDKAIKFAVDSHKNTKRKGNLIPYIVHPMEAMSIVATITEDQELLAAAALHDVIEDTDVTYDELKKEFGKRVADIVLAESVTEIPNYENMSWVDAKAYAIKQLREAPLDVKIVTLGDKLSNIRGMNRDFNTLGIEFWSRFRVKDPTIHKWRFYELLKCFKGLEETKAYKEFEALVKNTFSGV